MGRPPRPARGQVRRDPTAWRRRRCDCPLLALTLGQVPGPSPRLKSPARHLLAAAPGGSGATADPTRSAGVTVITAASALRALPLALATAAQNVLGLAFTIVFARWLGPTGYGSLAVLVSAFIVLSVPGSALQVEVARRLGASVARAPGDREVRAVVTSAWRWLRGLALLLVATSILGALAREPLATLLAIDEPWAAAILPATASSWALLCVTRGVWQALGRYGTVATSIVADSTLRIALAAPLVAGGFGVAGAFGGSALAFAIVTAVLCLALRREVPPVRGLAAGDHSQPAASGQLRLRDLIVETRVPLAALTLLLGMQEIHVIVAKHVAATRTAAGYAAAAVAAKSIIWVAMGLAMFVVPESARRMARQRDPRRALVAGLAVLVVPVLVMTTIFALSGKDLLALAFGAKLATASGALLPLGLAMSALAVTYVVTQYLLALERRRFVVILAGGLTAEVAAAVPLAVRPIQLALGLLAVFASVAGVVLAVAAVSAPRDRIGTRSPR